MCAVSVTIGSITLGDFEVPEEINFGGRQRLIIQHLIGGGRAISAVGADDADIVFSGIFTGADAVDRAQFLDLSRALGDVIPFVWDKFFYLVIISEFSAEYRQPNLIPFTIKLSVVSDPTAIFATTAVSLVSLVDSDLAVAGEFCGGTGVSLAGLSGTSDVEFLSVQSLISASILQFGSALDESLSRVANTNDPGIGGGAILQMADSSGRLAALTAMNGYVNRAAKNMAGALP